MNEEAAEFFETEIGNVKEKEIGKNVGTVAIEEDTKEVEEIEIITGGIEMAEIEI